MLIDIWLVWLVDSIRVLKIANIQLSYIQVSESYADRAEVHARDALDYAVAMIGDAEEAILDAVVARLAADAAQ